MGTKKITTNFISKERALILNSLPLFKVYKLSAVNTQWMQDGTTLCEIYNKSNKKRVKIKTNSLFNKAEFLDDKEIYLLSKEWFKQLLSK